MRAKNATEAQQREIVEITLARSGLTPERLQVVLARQDE